MGVLGMSKGFPPDMPKEPEDWVRFVEEPAE